MKIEAIVNFLLIAGAIQGFLFNFITLSLRKKYGPVIVYLNLVVLFISLNNLQAWLPEAGYSSGSYFLKKLVVPWYVFVFPCFYNFLRYFLGVQDKVRGYLKICMVLFLAEFLIRAAVIGYATNTVQDPDWTIERYNVLEEIVNMVFSLFVFTQCFILVFRKKELYAAFLDFDDVRWIKVFMILGVGICVVWLAALSLRAQQGFQDGSIYYPLRLATSVLLYWIGYQGLYRYSIVQERVQLRRTIRSGNRLAAATPGASSSTLDEKHAQEFARIQDYLLQEHRFLDPLLSLNTLAGEVSVSPGHLSRLINTHGNRSFTDFINAMRVEQAKEILLDPEFGNYTIAAIGLECGFNSKSTFYSAFKKFTSQSPSAFRSRV
jgi:AraC-like DNA-binding protein